MTCPAENTWMRYVGGALEPGSANELEQHLDGCAECRLLYANIAQGTDPTIAPLGDGTEPVTGVDAGTDPAIAPLASRLGLDQLLHPSELVRGAVVDRYLILGTLGRGGMGVVYKAFDPELDRPIALKLVAVNGHGADADESRARLLREAKTLAQLSHPNVVAVHDVGAHGNDVFVAMEFIAGTTLRRWLEHKRAPREILTVFRAAGAGLAAAHRAGIVHRDFKPDNMMVADDGRVRVLDFGLARSEGRATTRPSLPAITESANPDLTRRGTIMGTPAYMAPEQDLGHPVDDRSDQFSFCAALYEALFGRRPFAGTTYVEIAAHRRAGEIDPAPSVRGVSPRVRRAVLQGLRVDPAERHASMDALLLALGRPRRRARLAIAALALTSAAAIGWAAWVATHKAPTADELCAASAAEVERAWNPQRRSDLIASIDAMKLPAGHATALRVVDVADRYAAEWSAHRTKLCKLMVAGDGERHRDERTSARMECLKTRLTALDATMTVFIKAPTPAIVERADSTVVDLEPIATCEVTDTSRFVTAETRERWTPMIKDLVAGNAALANGDLAEAERLARRIVKWSTTNHETEPFAASSLLLGQVLSRQQDSVGARDALLEAVRAATEVREEEIATEAWLELVGLVFFDDDMMNDVDAWIFGAELAALRLTKDDDPVHSRLAYKIGSVQLLRGKIDAAVSKLNAARAAFERNLEKHRYDIAAVDISLGVAHMYRGEWDPARAAFDRSIAVWSSMPMLHPNLPSSVAWLGELAAMQHDFAGAEHHFKRAIESFESLGAAAEVQIGNAQLQLGSVYARMGRCDDARGLFAKALATEAPDPPSVLVSLTQLGEGLCQLDAGNASKAIELLERAAQVKTPATLLQPAHTDFALARALVVKDERRALELARRAREGFARFAGARADRDAVDAWLAKQQRSLKAR